MKHNPRLNEKIARLPGFADLPPLPPPRCSVLMHHKQTPVGASALTAIRATLREDTALGRLRGLAHATLDELAQEVCVAGEVDPSQGYEVALAGNATMTQLALGIDPEPVGVAPRAEAHTPGRQSR